MFIERNKLSRGSGPINSLRKKPLLVVLAVALIIIYWAFLNTNKPLKYTSSMNDLRRTYPSGSGLYSHQKAFMKYHEGSTLWRIAIVADKDKRSKNAEAGHWESKLRKADLVRNPVTNNYSVQWDEVETILTSKLAEEGRTMELSDLVYYNHQLLTFDDRTGIVYAIEDDNAVPQHILMDGNGHSTKGFKCEWATVKDGLLYVGSTGKEWTKNGVVVNNNPQWVKTIDEEGRINHIDWTFPYETMRKLAGASYPGYILHEAAAWNPILRHWYFLPRRFSTEEYDDVKDEERGANLVIMASEDFHDIRVYTIGPLMRTRGFSSIAFIPGRETEVVAIKSEEYRDSIASYITVFDIGTGEILMPETLIEAEKYEGVEII